MIGWDEALEGGINLSTTIMYWRGWIPEAPIEAAELGHQVIMTPTSHCYFDYESNNKSLTHVYNFDPIPEGLKGHHEESIQGVQANLWSERIPSMARLDYMSMPRMMSLAEVAWSTQKDEADFLKRVDNSYARLDAMGINYRLPDIPDVPSYTAFVKSDTLVLQKPEIIDEIRYTTDSSLPDVSSALYETPLMVTTSKTFKIASFRKGKSVRVYESDFEKQTYRKSKEANTQPGLQVTYYEGFFEKVAQLDEKKPVKSTIESKVVIPGHSQKMGFGLVFQGYIEVPQTDVYVFYLRSDDGSTLQIGDKLVVDNDGSHSGVEVEGQIALEKGKHPIYIKYFQGSGGQALGLKYHRKGLLDQKQEVGANMLSH